MFCINGKNTHYKSCNLDCGTCSNTSITFYYNNKNIFYNSKCGINDQSCFDKFRINEYKILYISKYNEVIEELYKCTGQCIEALVFTPIAFFMLFIYILYYFLCKKRIHIYNTTINNSAIYKD
jgi:hypothetical protein